MDLEAQMREGIDANKCMESQLMDPVMEVIMGQVWWKGMEEGILSSMGQWDLLMENITWMVLSTVMVQMDQIESLTDWDSDVPCLNNMVEIIHTKDNSNQDIKDSSNQDTKEVFKIRLHQYKHNNLQDKDIRIKIQEG